MSKAIKIGINFLTDFSDTVTKLRVNELGASTTNWVPEDEVQADALHVTANGEYSAAMAGKYCYDYVTVSVSGSVVTGKDPTTGKEMSVTKDPETGALDWEVLPVEIRVTTPPTLVQYTDGDTIDFTGLVVHAYDSDGDDLGAVPFGELVFPVTVADYSESRPVEYGATYDNTSALHNPDYFSQPLAYVESGMFSFSTIRDGDPGSGASVERKLTAPGGVICIEFTCGTANGAGATVLLLSLTSGKTVENKWRYGTWDYYETNNISLDNTAVTVGGTTVYYNYIATNLTANDALSTTLPQNQYVGQSYSDVTGGDGIQDVATIVFDGNSDIIGGGQTIPVQWPRPADGAVLESSFNIYVTPAP